MGNSASTEPQDAQAAKNAAAFDAFITEYKRRKPKLDLEFSERSLRRVLTRFHHHYPWVGIESLNEAISIGDNRLQDCPLVFVNDRFEQMTQFPRESIIGRNCRFLQGPYTDRSQIARLRMSIETGKQVEMELLNYRRDRSAFFNAIIMLPVRMHDNDKKPTFIVAIQKDVTRLKQRITAVEEWSPVEVALQFELAGLGDYAKTLVERLVTGRRLLCDPDAVMQVIGAHHYPKDVSAVRALVDDMRARKQLAMSAGDGAEYTTSERFDAAATLRRDAPGGDATTTAGAVSVCTGSDSSLAQAGNQIFTDMLKAGSIVRRARQARLQRDVDAESTTSDADSSALVGERGRKPTRKQRRARPQLRPSTSVAEAELVSDVTLTSDDDAEEDGAEEGAVATDDQSATDHVAGGDVTDWLFDEAESEEGELRSMDLARVWRRASDEEENDLVTLKLFTEASPLTPLDIIRVLRNAPLADVLERIARRVSEPAQTIRLRYRPPAGSDEATAASPVSSAGGVSSAAAVAEHELTSEADWQHALAAAGARILPVVVCSVGGEQKTLAIASTVVAFRDALNFVPSAVLVLDARHGVVVHANESCMSLLGYGDRADVGLLRGLALADLIGAEAGGALLQRHATRLERVELMLIGAPRASPSEPRRYAHVVVQAKHDLLFDDTTAFSAISFTACSEVKEQEK